VPLKVTVNGLPILGSEDGVEEFYRKYVLSGTGSFLIPASGLNDFGNAIRKKLVREIS